jgi:hypothetical protein
MPPDADVAIGTPVGSGTNLSLILLKKDMFGEEVERNAQRTPNIERG